MFVLTLRHKKKYDLLSLRRRPSTTPSELVPQLDALKE